MLSKSSEAYGEKGYKLGNHHFYNPEESLEMNIYSSRSYKGYNHSIYSVCEN
jgi:hypothetical protein